VYHPPAVKDMATDWFTRRTYHHRDYNPRRLVEEKERQGYRVSLCIPALNEASTIGGIVRSVRRHLIDRVPLLDELVVMDSNSADGTAERAAEAGALVIQDREVRPDLEPMYGKGEAMWKSLFATTGDLVAWLDADIRNFHPRFVYGVLGPLLTDPSVGYVKGFYERPVMDGDRLTGLGGGRVTELMARPLLNMFWPHLAGVVQPLAGEYAGRRSLLEQVPFFTGYGVEIGMLIDVADRFGIDAIAQVDLERRVHRNRDLADLSRMAFAVLQTAVRRLASSGRIELRSRMDLGLYLFEALDGAYRMEPSLIDVRERPPAVSVAGDGAALG
jgi:glycosyltransferase involved in cell wall biosynthesis